MQHRVVKRLVVAAMMVALPAIGRAQCTVSTDPNYGLSPHTAVPVGGNSPQEQLQREERYMRNLRGPAGETPVLDRRGSSVLPGQPNNRTVLLESYTITVPSQTVTIYLNLTDFGMPQAPAGFRCAQPISVALGPPPVDAMTTVRQTWDFVPQQYMTRELSPVSLDADGTAKHGVAFDNFRIMFLRARAGNGQIPPLPPSLVAATPFVIVAFPQECSGSPVLAESIEIVPARGTAPPRVGGYARGAQLTQVLPGALLPENAVGGMFAMGSSSFRPGDSVRIRYAASSCPETHEALLPVAFQAAKLASSPPPTLPAGVTEVEPTVFLQVIIDAQGRFEQPVVIGGPESLRAAALETIKRWTVSPVLVNGSPVFSFTTLRVTFVPPPPPPPR